MAQPSTSTAHTATTTTTTLHVVVTAHPDDESMFFVPCIHQLLVGPAPVWLLCLTTGNYDGLGEERSDEVEVAATDILQMDKALVLDDPAFQDHPSLAWNIENVAKDIERVLQAAIEAEQMSVSTLNLITFDRHGVSGHVNHRDTYFSVRHFFLQQHNLPFEKRVARNVTAWSLQTVRNILVKYIPILDWWRLILCWMGIFVRVSSAVRSDENNVQYRLFQPSLNWRAMAAHSSQFVWYRRLFVVFSCYTYSNKLIRMDEDGANG